MFTLRAIQNARQTSFLSHLRLPMTIAALMLVTPPLTAHAELTTQDIDVITTGSIASHAMLWTVDPSIILIALIAAFVSLIVAGFALARRSIRDIAIEQTRRQPRSFE